MNLNKCFFSILFLQIFFNISTTHSQSLIREFTISPSDEQIWVYSVCMDSAFNNYAVGMLTDPTFSQKQSFLLKTDSMQNIIWAYTYSTGGNIFFTSIRPANDGGFIIIGQGEVSIPASGNSVYVIKIDSSGQVLWSNGYEGFGGKAVCPTHDGGYLILGDAGRSTPTSGHYALTVIKTDVSGNPLWQYSYGLDTITFGEIGYDIKETNDGGFLVTGELNRDSISSNGSVLSDLFFLKGSVDGDIEWNKYFRSGNSFEASNMGNRILSVNDSSYIIAGYFNPPTAFSNFPMIMSVSEFGDFQWGSFLDFCGYVTFNKDVLPYGQGYLFLLAGTDPYVMETNANFSMVQSHKLPGGSLTGSSGTSVLADVISGRSCGAASMVPSQQFKLTMISLTPGNSHCGDTVSSCIQTFDFPFSGFEEFTMDTLSGFSTLPLTRIPIDFFDSTICIDPVLNVEADNNFSTLLKLFPNPAIDFINIQMETPEEISMVIYDQTGRKMQQEILNGISNRVMLHNYSSGIYVVVFTDKYGRKSLRKLGIVNR